jgi:hypothetical protein
MHPASPRSPSSYRLPRTAWIWGTLIALSFAFLISPRLVLADSRPTTELAAKAYAFWLKRLKTDDARSTKISQSFASAEAKLASLRPFLADPSFSSTHKLEVLNAELSRADAFLSKNARGIDSLARSFFEAKVNTLKKAIENGENRAIRSELSEISRFVSIAKKTFESPIL